MPKVIKEEVAVSEPRELATRVCDSFGSWEIYRIGGGPIPRELDGVYTGPVKAKTRLEGYLETQGFLNEKKKIQEEIKSIHPLDHEVYDD